MLQPVHAAASQCRTGVTDCDGELDCVDVCDSVVLRVAVGARVSVGVTVAATVPVAEGELEPVFVGVLAAVSELLGVCVADDDGVPVAVALDVIDDDGVSDDDGVPVAVCDTTPSQLPPKHSVQSPAASTAQQVR